MNKRLITYMLLVVVILIWGVIGYKLIFNKEKLPLKTLPTIKTTDTLAAVIYTPKYDYRDPFYPAPILIKEATVKSQKKTIVNRVNNVIVPNIQYKGKIYKSEIVYYLLEYNNTHFALKIKDTIAGYYLHKEVQDSLYLKKGRKIYAIKKHEI